MILSMTGYGHARMEGEGYAISVETSSVNNRFLKVSVRMPEVWQRLAPNVENLAKERLARGTVHINIHKTGAFKAASEFLVNRRVIEEYRRQLDAIEGGPQLSLADLLALPGVVEGGDEAGADLEEVWEGLKGLVEQALKQMIEMRRREGEHLRGVLLAGVERIRKMLDGIRAAAPTMVSAYRDRLTERVAELLRDSGVSVSNDDLAREVAIFAERSDIREEIDRMDSHLKQVASLMDAEGAVGRQLEFLVQEMFREMNTMGSKSADAELSRAVLDAKCEVDRLKEQVMNVE
jgi:uncharacterized protein (TIGR00255 family)